MQVVSIGNITTIPLRSGSPTTVELVVTNSGDLPVNYLNYNINNKINKAINDAPAIDISACSQIAPFGGTCKVIVTVPNTDGSFLLTMNFTDTAGKQYSPSQIIAYSSQIPSINGFTVSNNNLNINKAATASTTIAIPFLLDANYESAPTLTGSIAIFKSTLSCNQNIYNQGNLCEAFVNIPPTGTSVLMDYTLTISGTAISKNEHFKGINSKHYKTINDTFNQINVNLTITQNNVANIVTSATNVVINPANGVAGNAVLVYLLNTGPVAATELQLSSGATSPNAVITAGNVGTSCTSITTLAANASCSFFVNVNSAPTNTSGQTFVNVAYNNGTAEQVINFNVIYIGATSTVAMTMVNVMGSLQNIPQGQTATVLINVTNTSTTNTTLTNIAFTNPALVNAAITFSSASTCATNGTQSLVQNQSCTLVVSYTPTTTTDTGSLIIKEQASYTLNNQTVNYTGATVSVSYSSTSGNAFLWVNPSAVTLSIRADGSATATQAFVVTNSGGISTTISGIAFVPAVTGLVKDTGCTGGAATLAPNATCTVNVTYGPTSSNVANTNSNLTFTYLPNTGSNASTAFSQITVKASLVALMQITGLTITGTTTSGAGTSISPYVFTNYPGNQLTFTTTYKNNGTASASNFNVNTYNLPYGYVVSGTSTCPYSTSTPTTTLTTGQSCTIVTTVVNPTGYINPYNIPNNTALNFPLLGYSYTDTNSGVNVVNSPTCFSGCTAGSTAGTVYVTAQSIATVTNNTPTVPGGQSVQHVATITFTSTAFGSGLPAGGVDVIVNIPTSGAGQNATASSPTAGTNNACNITTATGTCTVTITSVANMPLGVYNYNYTIAPRGGTSGILQNLSFTLQ